MTRTNTIHIVDWSNECFDGVTNECCIKVVAGIWNLSGDTYVHENTGGALRT